MFKLFRVFRKEMASSDDSVPCLQTVIGGD